MVGITVVVVAYLFIKWRNRDDQLHHPSARYGDRDVDQQVQHHFSLVSSRHIVCALANGAADWNRDNI